MYKIERYKESYKTQIVEFITGILVEEFGFEKFRDKIKNTDFSDNENKFNWIAIDKDKKIIGTITLEVKDDSEAFLRKFYVSKEYRGSGLSKELFNTFLDFAKAKEYKKITLGTYENLNRAIAFYIKNGFKEIEKETENKMERHFCLELTS